MHNAIFSSLQTVWAARGISPGGGTTPGKIVQFEKSNELIVSDIFREYLKRYNGTKTHKTGEHLVRFLSLGQISEDPASCVRTLDTGSVLVVFAGCPEKNIHYAIQCWRRRTKDSGVFVVTEDSEERRFDTFAEFLKNYMKNEQCLMDPERKGDNTERANR